MSVEWAHMAVIIFVQTIQEVTHAAVTMGMIWLAMEELVKVASTVFDEHL